MLDEKLIEMNEDELVKMVDDMERNSDMEINEIRKYLHNKKCSIDV
jgi:hypothetical protein